jgi:hypothetical protein
MRDPYIHTSAKLHQHLSGEYCIYPNIMHPQIKHAPRSLVTFLRKKYYLNETNTEDKKLIIYINDPL